MHHITFAKLVSLCVCMCLCLRQAVTGHSSRRPSQRADQLHIMMLSVWLATIYLDHRSNQGGSDIRAGTNHVTKCKKDSTDELFQ